LAFTADGSPWATVALAGGAAGLARISSVVTPTVLLEQAGASRTTATGMFAVSNQLGAFGGASLGGLMLALGGFPLVGLFCLGVAVIAAVVIRLKVEDSPAFLEQLARRPGYTAPGYGEPMAEAGETDANSASRAASGPPVPYRCRGGTL